MTSLGLDLSLTGTGFIKINEDCEVLEKILIKSKPPKEKNSLNELKSKIILIQFTGIGCGPCHASIPFLKSLMEDYNKKGFELLQIETTNANIKALKSYHDKNEINCNYLLSNKKINSDYKIKGVPVFIILNDKRIVKNVIIGFRKGETEQVIIEALNQLL